MIETLQDLRNPEPVQQIHYVTYVFDPKKCSCDPPIKNFLFLHWTPLDHMRRKDLERILMMLPLLLSNRIPVLQGYAITTESHTTRNMNSNAEPRMSNVKNVAWHITSRDIVRNWVTSQKIALINRISLLPQVQAEWMLQQQLHS